MSPFRLFPLLFILASACGPAADPVAGGDPEQPSPYACGWRAGDPGDLASSGKAEGDTIANIILFDQCAERIPLWEFAGEYHVLFLTAAW